MKHIEYIEKIIFCKNKNHILGVSEYIQHDNRYVIEYLRLKNNTFIFVNIFPLKQ